MVSALPSSSPLNALTKRALEIFLAVVTSATEVGNTRPSTSKPESVAKIHEVCFYSLTSSTWDLSETLQGLPDSLDPMPGREPYGQQPPPPPGFEHPCMPLTKILSSGSFYYALEPSWDLSSRLSVRLSRDEGAARDVGTFDERFVWNEYIVRSLLDFRERLGDFEREDFDRCQFIVHILTPAPQISTQSNLDTCNSRLRGHIHYGSPCASYQWHADDRYPITDLASRVETCRN